MAIDASISDVPGLEQAAYITLTGNFDLRSADNFDAFWRRLIRTEKKRHFILDIGGVTDCSPVAVQVLRDFCEAAVREANGGVAVVNPAPPVLALIKELDLVASFAMFVDYKKAFHHLREVATEASIRDQERKKGGPATSSPSAGPQPPPSVPAPDADASQTGSYTARFASRPPQVSPVSIDDGSSAHLPKTTRPIDQAVDTGSVTGPDFVPPHVPSAGAGTTGGFKLRAFDAQGTLHTTDTSVTVQPGRRVLVLTPPGNDPARKMFCDAVVNAGFIPLLLFPLPEGHGFDHVANAVTQTEMVLADFAPARVRVLDPNAEVLTALTLARAIIGSDRLLIMTPNRTVPDMWTDVRHEQYNDSRAQLRKAIPVIVDRLRRMAVALAGGTSVRKS